MEKVDNTIKVHAQIFTFLVIWGVILLIARTYSVVDLWFAIKQIPQAISVYVIVRIVFTKWIWKRNILQGWLIKIPNLQGTWRGELKSDWVDPATGKRIAPIPMMLVIKQNFSSIQCTLMTKESTSYSTAAQINSLGEADDIYLTYNYTNRSRATIRDRSQIHDGAAILRIIRKPSLSLEGEYWTSRKTRGDISLRLASRQREEQFS